MAAVGVVAGAAFGLVVVRVAGSYFGDLKMPGAWPAIVSAFVLLGAAVVASMLPAARAAPASVMQPLRSEGFYWHPGFPEEDQILAEAPRARGRYTLMTSIYCGYLSPPHRE